MRRILALLFVFVLLIGSGCTSINEKPVADVSPDFDKEQDLSLYIVEEETKEQPEPIPLDPELQYVDTHYVKKLIEGAGVVSNRKTYDEAPPEWNFVLVDARPSKVFKEGHISGAINIPATEFEQKKQLLPEDKDTLLIFYCGGVTCHLSADAAKKAQDLGYTNIKVYHEGLPGWEEAGNYVAVTEDYVRDLIMATYVTRADLPPFVIIDARPYDQYFKAHIPNSVQMDDLTFTQKYSGAVPSDKETEIIVYCGGFGCHKSHSVAEYLVADGYTNVKVFAGGLPVWQAEKLPTFGMEGQGNGFNVLEGKVNRALTTDQFTAKIQAGATVLDVRTDAERAHGAIPGSIHIPDSVIHADPKAIVDQLPTDKNTTIVIHCASGARAGGVVDKIADLGYKNAYYLNHAIQVHEDGTYSF